MLAKDAHEEDANLRVELRHLLAAEEGGIPSTIGLVDGHGPVGAAKLLGHVTIN